MKRIEGAADQLAYYAVEASRKVLHYLDVTFNGFEDYGTLDEAADTILARNADRGFVAGSHFPSAWARDLAFSANGLIAAGYQDEVGDVAEQMLAEIDDEFYTRFGYAPIATPYEGVDTFPALVKLLDRTERLEAHADRLIELSELHRDKFFNEERLVVDGKGSSWWDSLRHPREAYNTAMLIDAANRLDAHDLDHAFAGMGVEIKAAMDELYWTGSYYREHSDSDHLAGDANAVPLYLGIVTDAQAAAIRDAMDRLVTPYGIRMRDEPFTRSDVTLQNALVGRTDYHYNIWPWNNFLYTNGLKHYGLETAAETEMDRIEAALQPYGNFFEILDLDGTPYTQPGYATAAEFTVATALWYEYREKS